MANKKRKSTNFVRKQEIDGLKEEMTRLQGQLRQLDPVPALISENTEIFGAIRQHELHLASVQSAILPSLVRQEVHPLHSRIHLKKAWEDRRATLLALRGKKFRAAYEYIAARSQVTNSGQPHLSDERFETANGDVCCDIFQTIHFSGVRSLKQVYDALLFSLDNVEISISERLGNVTIRDDYDDIDGSSLNTRILSTSDNGVATELNCIKLSQLFEGADDICGGQPCGIVTIDSVDEDELYPYAPSERIRKEVSAAFVLTERRPMGQNGGPVLTGNEETVVTLSRAAYVRLRRPEFELSESEWQDLQQETTGWGAVLVRSMRSVLYSTF